MKEKPRHIFLTGQIQVGKSTLINKALALFPQLTSDTLGGFRTITVKGCPPNALGSVYIIPAAADTVCDENNMVGIRWGGGKFDAYPQAFEKAGVPLLQEVYGKKLLLMDELGVMENNAPLFRREVLIALEGSIPVLGVIKPIKNPLLDAIRAHQRVEIIEVNLENRNSLLPLLQQILLDNGL